jgi:hypothetical protein
VAVLEIATGGRLIGENFSRQLQWSAAALHLVPRVHPVKDFDLVNFHRCKADDASFS